jgi:hypothetical protein
VGYSPAPFAPNYHDGLEWVEGGGLRGEFESLRGGRCLRLQGRRVVLICPQRMHEINVLYKVPKSL